MKSTPSTFVFANKFETLTDDEMVKVVGGKWSWSWKKFWNGFRAGIK